MYNQQTATATVRLPTEQVVLDCLVKHAQAQSITSPIYAKALNDISANGWQNSVISTTLKNILDLLNVRMIRYSGSPVESLLPECVRVVYSIVANVLAQKDAAWFNQLPYEVRQASGFDLQMANVVDQEIAAYAAQTGHLPNASTGHTRGSVYTRMQGQPKSTGAVPTTVAVEVPVTETTVGAYRPGRGGALAKQTQQSTPVTLGVPIVEAPVQTAYVPGRPGTQQRPLAAPQTPKPAPAPQPEAGVQKEQKMKTVYNPKTHSIKNNDLIEAPMDYTDHKPGHLSFPELSTSNKTPGNGVLSIAAGGLVFDPLSLSVGDGEVAPAAPTLEELATQVIHYPEQVLASGHQHAELMIRTAILDKDIALNDQLLSFEYRDFSPIHIYKTRDDAQISIAASKLPKMEQVGTITELYELIQEMKDGTPIDRQVANILNIRATEFINEFMALVLGLDPSVGWVTTDFAEDWLAVIDALQKQFAQKLPELESLMVQYTPMFMSRTVRSVWIDMETETANAVNRLAGIQAPTLRLRLITLSDVHAVFDVPLQASQLGIQLDDKMALLKPEAGCELFYEAVAQFLGRLIDDPASYRTLTIATSDEYLIRIRPTELPVSSTDTRRSIAIVSIRRD